VLRDVDVGGEGRAAERAQVDVADDVLDAACPASRRDASTSTSWRWP
jgi:hypothetical protein